MPCHPSPGSPAPAARAYTISSHRQLGVARMLSPQFETTWTEGCLQGPPPFPGSPQPFWVASGTSKGKIQVQRGPGMSKSSPHPLPGDCVGWGWSPGPRASPLLCGGMCPGVCYLLPSRGLGHKEADKCGESPKGSCKGIGSHSPSRAGSPSPACSCPSRTKLPQGPGWPNLPRHTPIPSSHLPRSPSRKGPGM